MYAYTYGCYSCKATEELWTNQVNLEEQGSYKCYICQESMKLLTSTIKDLGSYRYSPNRDK